MAEKKPAKANARTSREALARLKGRVVVVQKRRDAPLRPMPIPGLAKAAREAHSER